MITFDGVQVKFGDFTAIDDFNLTVEEGEFFTLLGPSGCGKTTALRSLAGFVTPSSGKILIDERDVTHLPSDQRKIGMVFQNYALFPSMSVYENIAFGLRVSKVRKKEIDERVRAIAAEVKLTDEQLAKDIAALSGGQQQRVAIARALVMKPRILLLDEPLSNLDAKLRNQLRVQLKDLQAQFGITTMYVTHDQDEALSMSDRIAVINEGTIEQVGTPREVYTSSATEFVCNFIGDVNKFRVPANIDGINSDLPAYARVEKMHIARIEDPAQEGVRLEGTVVQELYHGLHTSYTVEVDGQRLRAVVPESGRGARFETDQQVALTVAPEHIRQYEKV